LLILLIFDMVYFLSILDTWRRDVKSGDIKDAINEAAPDKLKLLHVSEVSLIPFCRIIYHSLAI
jgi:hypothetical protein